MQKSFLFHLFTVFDSCTVLKVRLIMVIKGCMLKSSFESIHGYGYFSQNSSVWIWIPILSKLYLERDLHTRKSIGILWDEDTNCFAPVWYAVIIGLYDIKYFFDFQPIASFSVYQIMKALANSTCFQRNVQKSEAIFCAPTSLFRNLKGMLFHRILRLHVQLQVLSLLLNQTLKEPPNQVLHQPFNQPLNHPLRQPLGLQWNSLNQTLNQPLS